MKTSLQLPKTLRLAQREDLPADTPESMFDEISNNNVIEGYKLHYNDNNPEHSELPFNFFSEINVDNSRLWDLVLLLSEDLPEVVSLIFGHIDHKPTYGKYVNKEYLLDFLSKYIKEFTQDTFIFFGLIYNDNSKFVEVFIDESKYIKYWGTDELAFRANLSKFYLNEIDNLNFVDEYPKVRESLNYLDEEAISSNDLINLLKSEFE